MSFILRIFFSGLIAFVPSPDGKELTVLLLKADHGYHVSDGSTLEPHLPILLAGAASCTGQCPTQDDAIAQALFPDKPAEQAKAALAEAVSGGGAWQLSGWELSLCKACSGDTRQLVLKRDTRQAQQTVPTTPLEREDFSWVADMNRIYPTASGINTALLTGPSDLIAAHLRLRSGKVFTYSLVQINGKVKPIHFRSLGEGATEAPYTQALASWVEAEIEVPGDTVQVEATSFGSDLKRSMTLSPRTLPSGQRVVEMAVLNLPPVWPASSAGDGTTQDPPLPGKHFELYYGLLQTPPAQRPVPQAATQPAASEPEVDWQLLHPREGRWSDLLDKIRLGIGRGPYSQVLCPMGQFSGSGSN